MARKSSDLSGKQRGKKQFGQLQYYTGLGISLMVLGAILAAHSNSSDSALAATAGLALLIGLALLLISLIVWLRRKYKHFRHGKTAPLDSAQSSHTFTWRPKKFWGLAILALVVIVAVASGPISDWLTIKNAAPAMIRLAQNSGMSRKGELLFLKAKPQLVSDAQMESDCASNAAANNSNGFIEQGCYIPSANRIYLRQMPSDLYSLEVSTAAYEMLHIAYADIVSQGQGPALNQAIENNYSSVNDPSLQSQVANFAKSEPGARDDELFSLLGTGYSDLLSGLANYYTPYFTNLSATVTANNQVVQLFNNDQSQLTQLQTTISDEDALANKAYADSVSWANAGNQYEDDYNYNIYAEDINTENNDIDQYNQLLQTFNTLVTEYDGTQPVTQIQSVQAQNQ